MTQVVELGPHHNMSVQECLEFCAREHEKFADVIVVGYDQDNKLIIRSSAFTRAEATFLLLHALDNARGIE